MPSRPWRGRGGTGIPGRSVSATACRPTLRTRAVDSRPAPARPESAGRRGFPAGAADRTRRTSGRAGGSGGPRPGTGPRRGTAARDAGRVPYPEVPPGVVWDSWRGAGPGGTPSHRMGRVVGGCIRTREAVQDPAGRPRRRMCRLGEGAVPGGRPSHRMGRLAKEPYPAGALRVLQAACRRCRTRRDAPGTVRDAAGPYPDVRRPPRRAGRAASWCAHAARHPRPRRQACTAGTPLHRDSLTVAEPGCVGSGHLPAMPRGRRRPPPPPRSIGAV